MTPAKESSPPGTPDIRCRINNLMYRLGLKRRDELLKHMGYSRTMLYHFEQGTAIPSAKFLLALEAMENRAAEGPGAIREEAHPDPVVRLLSGLEFPGIISVLEAGVSQLRSAGHMVPDACHQIQLALDEIRRRPPIGARNSHKKPNSQT